MSWVQILVVAIPTIGGVIIEWIKARDRRHHREALLAAGGNVETMRAIDDQAQPPKLPTSASAILVLFGLGLALASQARDPEYALAPQRRQCATADECDPGQRCERGRCVADALRSPPRAGAPAVDDLALWLRRPSERSDPYAPPLPIAGRVAILWRRRP